MLLCLMPCKIEGISNFVMAAEIMEGRSSHKEKIKFSKKLGLGEIPWEIINPISFDTVSSFVLLCNRQSFNIRVRTLDHST